MCNPLMFMAASAAVSVLGQMKQGQAAKQQADAQASQIEYQGRVTRDDALAQAQMIHKQQRFAVGAADVGAAGSGVQVGQGSSAEAERDIYQNSEHDAYMAILNGDRRARGLDTEAAYTRQAGQDARTNSYFQAAGTVLGSGYSALRGAGWRTGGAGFSGTQAPAPVVNRDFPKG